MTDLILPIHRLGISPRAGRSKLHLVGIDSTRVQTKNCRIVIPEAQRKAGECSYGALGRAPLTFSSWELCHAAKKTELTRSFVPQQTKELGLLFQREHHDRFIWNTDNLRCADGSGLWLEDFSGRGLAGRIGEAIAYLTMTKMWKYTYWDRIASVYMRAARNATITHAQMLRVARFTGNLTGRSFDLQPDFVFENGDKTVALMEAKGSFVSPENKRPDAKGLLNHGLNQTAKWAPLITPAPAKNIVIASLLREASDDGGDPSLILHVDTPAEGSPDIKSVEFGPDDIRRGNFGAWLMGMGFRNSGLALADRREIATDEIELPVVRIDGLDFALSIQGWRVNRDRFPTSLLLHFAGWQELRRYGFDFLRRIGVTGAYALGLEVGTLRAVCAALVNLSPNSMMDLRTIDLGDAREQDGFYGSIFPDGSILGIVSSRLLATEMRTEKFAL